MQALLHPVVPWNNTPRSSHHSTTSTVRAIQLQDKSTYTIRAFMLLLRRRNEVIVLSVEWSTQHNAKLTGQPCG
jgi:hypothetical protein